MQGTKIKSEHMFSPFKSNMNTFCAVLLLTSGRLLPLVVVEMEVGGGGEEERLV